MSDVFATADSVKRRRALLEALQGQSMQAPIVGHTGIGQALAKLGTAYLTNKGQKRLDSEASQNQQNYQQQLSGELDKFMNTREGTPDEMLSNEKAAALMYNDVDPQLKNGTAADPRAAIFQAIASRFPEMQQVGQAGLKDLTAGRGPRSANPANIKEVNGKLVDITDPASPRVIGDFSKPDDKYGEPYMIKGPSGQDVLVRKNLSSNKVESVASSGQQINVNTGDVAGIRGLVEANMPGGKANEAAKAAQQSLMLANEQISAINQGAQSGSLGNVQQELRKFGELLGVENAATAPTEMLGNLAKQRVLAKLGGLGAQISNSDRDFLSQAQGDLTTNPAAFKRMLAISMAADIKALSKFGKGVAALTGKIDPALQEAMKTDFAQEINDPEVSAMIDRVLAGKPSVDGPAARTAPGTSGGGQQKVLRPQDLTPAQRQQLLQMLQPQGIR